MCCLCRSNLPRNRLVPRISRFLVPGVEPVPTLTRTLNTPADGFERQGAYEGPGKTTVSILNQVILLGTRITNNPSSNIPMADS